MKKRKVKEMLNAIRDEMIDEIAEENRIDIDSFRNLIKEPVDFIYGYKVGLSQAAMIMLEWMEELFTEEKDDETKSSTESAEKAEG